MGNTTVFKIGVGIEMNIVETSLSNRIQKVTPEEDFCIRAVFYNGQCKKYDVKQLFKVFPQFTEFITEPELFQKVQVDPGGYGISWNEELDLDAESIWENGILIENEVQPDLNHLIAYAILLARENKGMTQRELSEKTGIYQAEISKLERGIGNPSLLTLKRIADGLDLELKVDFVIRK